MPELLWWSLLPAALVEGGMDQFHIPVPLRGTGALSKAPSTFRAAL